MRTLLQSLGRRWYGQNVTGSSRSLVDLGVLAFDDPFFDQNFSPLLLRSILVKCAPLLSIDFDVHVFIGWPCSP